LDELVLDCEVLCAFHECWGKVIIGVRDGNGWLVELGEVIIGVRNEVLMGLDDFVELCKG
jgi:hypothetical protein